MTEPVPRPAATVALLRDSPRGTEVLLTERPATMAFGPRLHVFPGGALDAGDADPRILARLRPLPAGDPGGVHGPAFAVAAIREAWEEAGILLAGGRDAGSVPSAAAAGGAAFRELVLDLDLELRGDLLVPLSRWVTPPVVPRRYDARFFAAWLPSGIVPAFDPREVAGHDWMTPAAALAAMAERRIELWMPTSATLQQLLGVRRPGDLASLAARGPCWPPVVEAVDGSDGLVVRVASGGAGGVPGARADAFVIGRRRVLIVDPGDPGDEAADAILAVLAERDATVGAVLVTAPSPERAGGAEGLALRFEVPLLAAAEARGVLAADVVPVARGDALDVADLEIGVVAPAVPVGGPGFGPEASLAVSLPATGIVLEGGSEVVRR